MNLMDWAISLLGVRATALTGDPLMFDRWRFLKRHLLPGAWRTLDAGCGSGAFILYAGEIGNSGVGISFDEECNKKGKMRSEILHINNINFITADLRELDQYSEKLGTFDQIICFETLEHILNDAKLIKDLSELLKPGGRIILTTPYKYYRHLPGDKVSPIEDGGHVRWGYSHQEIGALLEKHGLHVMVEENLSGFISQKLTHLIRLFSTCLPNMITWALIFPFRIFVVFDDLFTKIIKYPFMSIGVVGLKND
jgi:2-polyprenyl-3-methyl-5-hydroxy-6-metoxy-1,4-benzoquinol methylase